MSQSHCELCSCSNHKNVIFEPNNYVRWQFKKWKNIYRFLIFSIFIEETLRLNKYWDPGANKIIMAVSVPVNYMFMNNLFFQWNFSISWKKTLVERRLSFVAASSTYFHDCSTFYFIYFTLCITDVMTTCITKTLQNLQTFAYKPVQVELKCGYNSNGLYHLHPAVI